MLVGLWLFTTIWALNYPQTAQAQSAHLNEIMVGIVVLWNGLARLVQEPTVISDVILMVAGAWLIAAPFAVGYTRNSEASSAMWADIVTGAVILALGLFSFLGLRAGKAGAAETATA
ncbi:SPW repeat protein [Streptacidiphilus monticola]